jgi:hypothetical protein
MMWLSTSLGYLQSVAARRRPLRARPRPPRRRPAGFKPLLERLEERRLLSGGISDTLVALGGATPLPIPGGLGTNPGGGPDIHFDLPGPADSTVPGLGGEPSSITNFNGFIGVARVQGTGTDGNGNTLLWDADVRFMQGVYQGMDGNIHRGTFAEV